MLLVHVHDSCCGFLHLRCEYRRVSASYLELSTAAAMQIETLWIRPAYGAAEYEASSEADFFASRRRLGVGLVRVNLMRPFLHPLYLDKVLKPLLANACHLCGLAYLPCWCRGKFARTVHAYGAVEFKLSATQLTEFRQCYPSVEAVELEEAEPPPTEEERTAMAGRHFVVLPQDVLRFLGSGHDLGDLGREVLPKAALTFLDFPPAAEEFRTKQDHRDTLAIELFKSLRVLEGGAAAQDRNTLALASVHVQKCVNACMGVAQDGRRGELATWEDFARQRGEGAGGASDDDEDEDDQPPAARPTLRSAVKGFCGSGRRFFAEGATGVHVNIHGCRRGEGAAVLSVSGALAKTLKVRSDAFDLDELFSRGARGPTGDGGLHDVVLSDGSHGGHVAFHVPKELGTEDAFREELERLFSVHMVPLLLRRYLRDRKRAVEALGEAREEEDEDADGTLAGQIERYFGIEGGGDGGEDDEELRAWLEAIFGRELRAYRAEHAAELPTRGLVPCFVREIGRHARSGDRFLLVRHPVTKAMLSLTLSVDPTRRDLCLGSCALYCQWIEGDYDGDRVKILPGESAERARMLERFDVSRLLYDPSGRCALRLSGAAPDVWKAALAGGEQRPLVLSPPLRAPPLPRSRAVALALEALRKSRRRGGGGGLLSSLCKKPPSSTGPCQIFGGPRELRMDRGFVLRNLGSVGLFRQDLVRPAFYHDAEFAVRLENGTWLCPAEVWRRPGDFKDPRLRRFAASVSDDGYLPVERLGNTEEQRLAAAAPQLRELLRRHRATLGPLLPDRVEVQVLRLRSSVLDDFAVREQLSLQLAFISVNFGRPDVEVLHAPSVGVDRGAVLLRRRAMPPPPQPPAALGSFAEVALALGRQLCEFLWKPSQAQCAAGLRASLPRLPRDVAADLELLLRHAETVALAVRHAGALRVAGCERELECLLRLCVFLPVRLLEPPARDADLEACVAWLQAQAEACRLSLLCRVELGGGGGAASLQPAERGCVVGPEQWRCALRKLLHHDEATAAGSLRQRLSSNWRRFVRALLDAAQLGPSCPDVEDLAEVCGFHYAPRAPSVHAELLQNVEHLAQRWVHVVLPAVRAEHLLPFQDEDARVALRGLRELEEHCLRGLVDAACDFEEARKELTLLLKGVGRVVSLGLLRQRSLAPLARLLRGVDWSLPVGTLRVDSELFKADESREGGCFYLSAAGGRGGILRREEGGAWSLQRPGEPARAVAVALGPAPRLGEELRRLFRARPRLVLCRSPHLRLTTAFAVRSAAYAKENAAAVGLAPVVGALSGYKATVASSVGGGGALSADVMAAGYRPERGFILEHQAHLANKDGKNNVSVTAGLRRKATCAANMAQLEGSRIYGQPVEEGLCYTVLDDNGQCGERCHRDLRGLRCRHCGFLEQPPKRKRLAADAGPHAIAPHLRGRLGTQSLLPGEEGGGGGRTLRQARGRGVVAARFDAELLLLRGARLLTLKQATLAPTGGEVATALPPGVVPASSPDVEIFPGSVYIGPDDENLLRCCDGRLPRLPAAGPWVLGPGVYVLVRRVGVPVAPPQALRAYEDQAAELEQARSFLESEAAVAVRLQPPPAEAEAGGGAAAAAAAAAAGGDASAAVCVDRLVEEDVDMTEGLEAVAELAKPARDIKQALGNVRAALESLDQYEDVSLPPRKAPARESSSGLSYAFDFQYLLGGKPLAAGPSLLLEHGAAIAAVCARCKSTDSRLRVQLPGKRLVSTCRRCASEAEAQQQDAPGEEDMEGFALLSDHRGFQLHFYRYLLEFRSWGFPVVPGFSDDGRSCLLWEHGTFEDYLRLHAKWRQMAKGQLVEASTTLLRRHHDDDFTHALTTQDGVVGHFGRPYAQRYRTDLLQLATAPRPELVASYRDRSAM
jgi:hypothetical protein